MEDSKKNGNDDLSMTKLDEYKETLPCFLMPSSFAFLPLLYMKASIGLIFLERLPS